jgi:hypothetical protein
MAYMHPSGVYALYEALRPTVDPVSPLSGATTRPVFVHDEATGAQAFIVNFERASPDTRRVVAVVVRGSDETLDWIHNVDSRLSVLSSTPLVRAHSGFLKQSRGLESKVMVPVRRMMEDEDSELCVLGHSAGAAVGALCSLSCAREFEGRVQYIGLGSPRVGDIGLAALHASLVPHSTVVKYGSDPVTKLSPSRLYTHVCEETTCGPRDPFPSIISLSRLRDHDVDAYVRALEERTGHYSVKDRATTLLERIVAHIVRSGADWLLRNRKGDTDD